MTDKFFLNWLSRFNSWLQNKLGDLYNSLARAGIDYNQLPEDDLFRFEDYPQTQQKAAPILQQFHKEVVGQIEKNISSSINKSFDAGLEALSAYQLQEEDIYTKAHRKAAEKAFKEYRIGDGKELSLSDKVWNYTEQAKAEFEMAISQKIEDGLQQGSSAEDIGREVRSMLNDPDAVYRRYHRTIIDATGAKRKVVEWRRRVIDENGKVHYVSTGMDKLPPGVYHSARQNALRLAATEINMAYRYADNYRWQKQRFVLGFEVRLSQNHPIVDICDKLAGQYPKDFLWCGWHPRCRCYAVAITLPYEERLKIYKLPKEVRDKYVPEGVIKDVPDNFKEWFNDNKERIVSAYAREKVPYFLRDNYKYVEALLKEAEKHIAGLRISADDVVMRKLAKIPINAVGKIQNFIDVLNRRINLFKKGTQVYIFENDNHALMQWSEKGVGISCVEFTTKSGAKFCPVTDLLSAIEKLSKRQVLSFNEEYAIEALFHENIHSKVKKNIEIQNSSFEELILETCVQLYARHNYTAILKYYKVEPINFEAIQTEGYGYNRLCQKLRGFFVKNGQLQVGELVNIANQTESGERILCKKLTEIGLTPNEIDMFLNRLLYM